MKKTERNLILLFLLSAVFFISSAAVSTKKVAVVMRPGIPAYETVLENLKAELKSSNAAVRVEVYEMSSEEDNPFEKLKKDVPAVVVPFGTKATMLAKDNFKRTPVVFTMVLNPEKEGIKADNITGVSLDAPVFEQFKAVKSALASVKRIGIMYNPANSSDFIEEAKKSVKGLNIELVLKPVASSKDIPAMLEEIKTEIDVIWAVPDSTVYNSATSRHILLFSLRNKLPVIGFSASFAKAGAVVGVYSSYEDIGRQTAEQIVEILNGKKPSEIPVLKPRKIKMALNLNAAGLFGMEISNDVVKEADEVFR